MAIDKAVDSAKLDAALNATAKAIQSKTGGTSKIAWNASTGFASAVEQIKTGGGAEMVKGSVGLVGMNAIPSYAYYTNEEGTGEYADLWDATGSQITVAKGSYVIITNCHYETTCTNATVIERHETYDEYGDVAYFTVFKITGNNFYIRV